MFVVCMTQRWVLSGRGQLSTFKRVTRTEGLYQPTVKNYLAFIRIGLHIATSVNTGENNRRKTEYILLLIASQFAKPFKFDP